MAVDVLIPLDRAAPCPLRDQIYDGLRAAILEGRLGAGVQLPGTRALAAQLGISRFTVADAYARLVAEGYVEGRHGSGTYVGLGPPGPAAGAGGGPGAGAAPAAACPRRAWSTWGTRVGTVGPAVGVVPPARFDFRHGMPSLDAFPHALWTRLRARAARDVSLASRDYGPIAGYPPLRAAIAAYLARSRGIRGDQAQVVVTTGAQQALDLLARLWLDPADVAAMEDPGYPAARRVFAAAGARVVSVPVDGDGVRVDRLRERAGDAKLVYVTPSHQYPTGGVLPLARRWDLLAWARERGALVVEDDYDGEFRYGSRPVPALAGLDADTSGRGVVAYVGTFSKVIYPALRLGYVVLPPDMVDRFAAAKAIADLRTSTVDQAALTEFIAEGHFERHLARMRRLYAARQAALVEALATGLAGVARRQPEATAAGLHLLIGFDLPLPEPALIARAAAAGVALDGAAVCFATAPPPRPSALLGYALLPEERIRAGIRTLAAALTSGGGRRAGTGRSGAGWHT